MDYPALFDSTQAELNNIDLTVAKTAKFLAVLADYEEDSDSCNLMVAGLSVNLQGVCMRAERLLSQIANNVDGYLPTGERWQHRLFEQMAQAVPGKREPVISAQSLAFLVALRSFKISVRGGCGGSQNDASVIEMATQLPGCYEAFKSECLMFHQAGLGGERGAIAVTLVAA